MGGTALFRAVVTFSGLAEVGAPAFPKAGCAAFVESLFETGVDWSIVNLLFYWNVSPTKTNLALLEIGDKRRTELSFPRIV